MSRRTFWRWRRGREAEGGGLLNRYRVVKLYRGFESLRLRQPPVPGCFSKKRRPPKTTGFPPVLGIEHSLAVPLRFSLHDVGQGVGQPSKGEGNDMARTTERLNSLQVKRLKEPGRFHDGGGLYLAVTPGGSKNWLFRYRTHWMGLGAFPTFGLAEARERATAARRLLSDGKDPIEQRRRDRAAARGTITFREAAKRYIEAHRAGWKNPKHIAQWGSTIATYVEQ